MSLRAVVFRGLPKEVEEDVNKFLSTHDVLVVHVAQSEAPDGITITLLVQEPPRRP